MSDQSTPAASGQGDEQPTEAESPPASPAKKRRIRLILLVVLVVVLVAGALWFMRYQSYGKYIETTNDAYVQADAVVVSSKVSGYAAQILVTDNQEVKAGQPLVRIDSRDYQAQAEQAQAQIGVAQANAAGIRAQIGEQRAAIAQARAEVAAAESAWRFAGNQVARYTPLAASGAETREQLAQLRDQQSQAAAKLGQARAGLVAAQRRVGTLDAQIGQARSQGRAAEAQLKAADVNVGATLIRASVDGRVGSKSVQLGQLVQPGERLMSVVPAKFYVSANFKETQLGLMRVGQPVTVKVDALSDVELHGRIASVSPGTGAQFSVIPPQNATGNFTKIVQRVPVRIEMEIGPETRKLLVPGMSVEVDVNTKSAKGADDRIRDEQDAFERQKAAR